MPAPCCPGVTHIAASHTAASSVSCLRD